MTKMALRKTILLLTVAVLAVIYSLQLVLGSRNKIQTLSVTQSKSYSFYLHSSDE